MKIEVKVPAVGESITEATIGSWSKQNGEAVKRNDVLMLLETDKASVEVVAENDGVLFIQAQAGEVVKIGATVAYLDTDAKASVAAPSAAASASAPANSTVSAAVSSAQAVSTSASADHSPAVQRLVGENNLNVAGLSGTGKDGRLTKGDVIAHMSAPAAVAPSHAPTPTPKATATSAPAPSSQVFRSGVSKQGEVKRVQMTNIRKRIAEKLVNAQHTAALLTTFNEIDMSQVTALRNTYKDKFKEKYSVSLGFNGFFVKAALEALKAFPAVNAWIENGEIEYHNYYNIGIAVSTEKGLMVPVVKDADQLSIAGIELAIKELAVKGRDGKISIDDLSGGTFSITNGGVFGSLMSTPILNAPQSAILGLHKVQDRVVAINGKVEIRPMMYVALTYDHRIIDGKEAVSFLVKIKECVENPERLLLEI